MVQPAELAHSQSLTAARFVVFVKKECHTCSLIEPVLRLLHAQAIPISVYVQDDPQFLSDLDSLYDRDLRLSFLSGIEVTPTLIRIEDERETGRTIGWVAAEWEQLLGCPGLGKNLPDFQPGCGSKTREPGVYEQLVAQFGNTGITARRVLLDEWDDPMEACFERGWTDGLPVVPPTDDRILRMLSGTSRAPGTVVGDVPPNLAPCTVEKVAINAVLAGCKPEYMPVLLSALEAALDPVFTMHGLLCTT